MAGKWMYLSKTWAGKTFASGMFNGVGVSIAPIRVLSLPARADTILALGVRVDTTLTLPARADTTLTLGAAP